MWYFHKESGLAVDLNQIRLLCCFPNAVHGSMITFYFLDGSQEDVTFESDEQRKTVFDEIIEKL